MTTLETYGQYGCNPVHDVRSLVAIKGKQEQSDMESGCAPYCQQADADSMRRKYLIADLPLGVGLVSLGAATYLLIRNAGRSSQPASSAHIGVNAVAGRGAVGLDIGGRF